jgi:uncharacterized protein (DUF302 family)
MTVPIVHHSRFAYPETIALLTKAITAAGATLFAAIDQSAAAESAGLTLRPTTLLIFGNPKGGTPLMDAFPLIALELPLKLAIWDESGTVSIAYEKITTLAERYGVTGNENLIAALDRTLETLVGSVTER